MQPKTPPIELNQDASQGTLASYTAGFILSLALTLIPYLIVQRHLHHEVFSRTLVVIAIMVFAIAQLVVQLVLFLHLDKGSQRRWNLLVLSFAAMVVIIVVFGSLWIMHNLNYRTSPAQMLQYMSSQNGF